jgi:hypothetical protein
MIRIMEKTVEKVCKDKDGKWTLFQFPNLPLLVWLLCVITSRLTNGDTSTNISNLGNIFLSIWAYLEIAYGDSIFRRILGSIVLLAIVLNNFN